MHAELSLWRGNLHLQYGLPDILLGYVTGTGTIMWLPQQQFINASEVTLMDMGNPGTVQAQQNAVPLLQNTYDIHIIALPWGGGMGWVL